MINKIPLPTIQKGPEEKMMYQFSVPRGELIWQQFSPELEGTKKKRTKNPTVNLQQNPPKIVKFHHVEIKDIPKDDEPVQNQKILPNQNPTSTEKNHLQLIKPPQDQPHEDKMQTIPQYTQPDQKYPGYFEVNEKNLTTLPGFCWICKKCLSTQKYLRTHMFKKHKVKIIRDFSLDNLLFEEMGYDIESIPGIRTPEDPIEKAELEKTINLPQNTPKKVKEKEPKVDRNVEIALSRAKRHLQKVNVGKSLEFIKENIEDLESEFDFQLEPEPISILVFIGIPD